MPLWLTVFLVAVIALLVRETLLLLGQRTGRVLDLTHPRDRLQRRIVGLRLLAWLSLVLALGQRNAYKLGWDHRVIDFTTSLFLLLAVALVVTAWHLGKRHRG